MKKTIPPQAIQAEMALIGSMLLSGKAVDAAMEHLQAEDFYNTHHRQIFEKIQGLVEKNYPVDLVSVGEETKKSEDDTDRAADTLKSCLDQVLVADNPGYYIKKIKEKSDERRARNLCTQYLGGETSRDELLVNLEQFDMVKSDSIRSVGEGIENTIEYIEAIKKGDTDHVGISTGYPDIDRRIGGMKKGNYIVLAARPSHGKSLMAVNIARKVAVKYSKPVLIFSFESGIEEIRHRLLLAESGVSEDRIRRDYAGKPDWSSLVRSAGDIKGMPIYVSDNVDLNPVGMRARARQFIRRHPDTCLIIIDYLQEITAQRKTMTEFEKVTDASRQSNKMGKELGVPVIALSQLNRKIEERKVDGDDHRRPCLADLRQTGQIEQDADIIIFMDYAFRNNPEEEENKTKLRLYTSKVRNGVCGQDDFVLEGDKKRIESRIKRGLAL